MRTLRSSSTGTIETAPGWCTRSRWNVDPSGASNVPTATEIRVPVWTDLSASLRNGVNLQQARLATLGPGEGGAHQFPEQRMGTVGAAPELGVGLGADPERVARQLDELDQPVVGRRSRAAQAGLLQASAVAGVELVAVPVPLVDDRLAVGPGHLRTRLELGRVQAQPHRAA